ncbi:MAG: response regulator transcription factor [Treponema sp.]|uniref:response regulator transcription factor n=1 Tax=Treponema sp. TaxID=166 RepID=UPI00298D9E4A|nr:response regulator transcription factor [uncultured Treponema sp.]MBR0155056.1 response regulator transcription factor [Treponema sp.]
MTVALVDDEKNVRLSVKTALKKEGFEVTEFSNGQEALNAVSQNILPDIFILDIMMPVMDGISFLTKIRELRIKTPVMFLTSRDEEFDKVLGLELGADDYLCKPFSVRELIARVKVLLRRSSAAQEEDKIISSDNITLNLSSYSAYVDGKKIELTVTEFRILEAFIKNKGSVLTRDKLIEISYPDDTYLNDRAIDCHIKRLRKKLPENSIETVYGLGYRF